MNRLTRRLLIAVSALFTGACACAKPAEFQPALINNASETTQQTVTQAMQKLANKSVRLPSRAFMDSPQLLLTDKITPSQQNPKGLGMEHLPPHRFELQSNGKDCWLAYLNTQEKIKLIGVNCAISAQKN